MVGFKRRTRVEGWALDVSDSEEVGYRSAIQRWGENNRLWIAALILLIVVSVILICQTKQGGEETNKSDGPRQAAVNGDYLNQAHKDFATGFIRDKGKEGLVIDAKFVDDRKFAFVVPGETGADDIEYLSKIAAELHRAHFKTWVTVAAYQRSAATGNDTLRAETTWVAPRYGFVVKFIGKDK